MLDIGVKAVLVHIGDAERIGVEAAVEARILEHPGDMLVAGRGEHVVQIGRGVAPPARVCGGGAGLEVSEEVKAAFRLHTGGHIDAPTLCDRGWQWVCQLDFRSTPNPALPPPMA